MSKTLADFQAEAKGIIDSASNAKTTKKYHYDLKKLLETHSVFFQKIEDAYFTQKKNTSDLKDAVADLGTIGSSTPSNTDNSKSKIEALEKKNQVAKDNMTKKLAQYEEKVPKLERKAEQFEKDLDKEQKGIVSKKKSLKAEMQDVVTKYRLPESYNSAAIPMILENSGLLYYYSYKPDTVEFIRNPKLNGIPGSGARRRIPYLVQHERVAELREIVGDDWKNIWNGVKLKPEIETFLTELKPVQLD